MKYAVFFNSRVYHLVRLSADGDKTYCWPCGGGWLVSRNGTNDIDSWQSGRPTATIVDEIPPSFRLCSRCAKKVTA